MIPPMKAYPVFERPSGSAASAKRVSPVSVDQAEMWAWQPEPVRSRNGLGMKVARRPCFSAMERTMYLKKAWRSAVSSTGPNPQFISNWPFASSWSFWYGSQPSTCMASQISVMTS
jgi:hypothetical protein